MTDFSEKLERFMKRVERDRNLDTQVRYPGLYKAALKDGRRGYHEIGCDPGNRFIRVWDSKGPSSKSVSYFVEIDTGIIFGAKSWKIYNPNHEYGTLDTIDEWDWAGYYARNKNGKSNLVPKNLRR